MDLFKVVNFEKNNLADSACKDLLKQSPTSGKRKNAGKIAKKTTNKKIENTLKLSTHKGNGIKLIQKIPLKKQNSKHSGNTSTNTFENNKQKEQNKQKAKKMLRSSNGIQRQKSPQEHSFNKHNSKHLKISGNKEKNSNKAVPVKNHIFKNDKQKHKKQKLKNQLTKSDDATPLLIEIKSTPKVSYIQKKSEKLQDKLKETLTNTHLSTDQKSKAKSLRARMLEKLQAARFRYINEQIYSSNSQEVQNFFSNDPDTFQAYHKGYKQQVNKWPLNPLDVIIKSVQKMPKTHVIADFGCGEAKLAKSVVQKVNSFDLVATNDLVTACDMAHVPLANSSVDAAVFCLSLMGTNLHDYILEANRVLKDGGNLKIAEVESRFDDVQQFIEGVQRFNFKLVWKDLAHNLFYFFDFKKVSNIKNKKKLPTLSLNPCLYKKR